MSAEGGHMRTDPDHLRTMARRRYVVTCGCGLSVRTVGIDAAAALVRSHAADSPVCRRSVCATPARRSA